MTIEFDGRVKTIQLGTSDRVRVVIDLATHRSLDSLVLSMSRAEARQYMPGSGVRVQIRPNGEIGTPFSSSEDTK